MEPPVCWVVRAFGPQLPSSIYRGSPRPREVADDLFSGASVEFLRNDWPPDSYCRRAHCVSRFPKLWKNDTYAGRPSQG
jgi:hypothetical protein